MKNQHNKKNQPKPFSRAESPHPQSTSATLQLLPSPQPDLQRLTSPFPTRIERALFKHPWIPIFGIGISHAVYINVFDLIFIATTTVLAVSASLFRHWLNQLPSALIFIQDRYTQPPPPEAIEHISNLHAKLTSRGRLILPLIAAIFSFFFLAVFLARVDNILTRTSWFITIGLWAWMIGAAGHIAINTAKLFRTLGKLGKIQVLPDHPDTCGGLQPLGLFFAWLVSPLIITTVYLSLVATNPTISPTQDLAMAELSGAIKPREPLAPKSEWLSKLVRQKREQFSFNALEVELREALIQRLKKSCTELETTSDDDIYKQCLKQIHREILKNKSATKQIILFNQTVILFSRTGLLILLPFTALCLAWPLASIHRAMIEQRDQQGRELAESLQAASLKITGALRRGDIGDAATLAKHFEEVQKQTHRIKKYPTWPFGTSLLTKIALPQVLALFGTSWKTLADVLSGTI